MFDMSVKWPHGARVAVMLTFDFDAETLWTSRDPENARRLGVLSRAREVLFLELVQHNVAVACTVFHLGERDRLGGEIGAHRITRAESDQVAS